MSQSLDSAWLATEASEDALNPHQFEMYCDHRRELLTWLLTQGKHPEVDEGYSANTVRTRAYHLDLFYRFVWEIEGRYTEDITLAHANAWMKYLSSQPLSSSYKSLSQKAVQLLFKWQRYEQGKEVDWEPPIRFQGSSLPSSTDTLTREERTLLREAVLSYDTIPNYHAVSPDERDQWKAYLAQRLGKPKDDITKEDWARANSWKLPSMIWTTIDAGLRPIEVGRAKVSWVDLDDEVLRIPAEDAIKNDIDWTVGLRTRTAKILKRWLAERETRNKYQDTDRLWLTKYGNPYGSWSLNYWFRKLCDEAGIDRSNRNLSWYSIRHSVGTYMVSELNLGAASAQLRHKSLESTLRYVHAPVEDRQDALERMG